MNAGINHCCRLVTIITDRFLHAQTVRIQLNIDSRNKQIQLA